jgi:hypothetical protein
VQDDEDLHILLKAASAQFITVCQCGCTALASSVSGHPWPALIESRARHTCPANQVAAIVSPRTALNMASAELHCIARSDIIAT